MMIETQYNINQKCCFIDMKNLDKMQVIDNMIVTHIMIEVKESVNRVVNRTVKYRLADSDNIPYPDLIQESDIFYTSEKAKFWIEDYLIQKSYPCNMKDKD